MHISQSYLQETFYLQMNSIDMKNSYNISVSLKINPLMEQSIHQLCAEMQCSQSYLFRAGINCLLYSNNRNTCNTVKSGNDIDEW